MSQHVLPFNHMEPSAEKFRQMDTQKAKILNHLQTLGSLENNIPLMRLYGVRIAARINELRKDGHNITTTKGSSGQAIYKLEA
jgi:hypothetical protein